MRTIFLDACVPHTLRRPLRQYDCTTASFFGWEDLANGELLQKVEEAGFEVFVTCDKNLSYQQNLAARRIALFVLPTTNSNDLCRVSEGICRYLEPLQPGDFVAPTMAELKD